MSDKKRETMPDGRTVREYVEEEAGRTKGLTMHLEWNAGQGGGRGARFGRPPLAGGFLKN
jgi:hypothetical protein